MGSIKESQPKVLFYNHSGIMSGAEICLLHTMRHMVDIQKLLVAPDGELLERARRCGMRVRVAKSYRARMRSNPVMILRGVLGTWMASRELRRIVMQESPDILHANSVRAGLIALMALWRKKHPKLIWHVQDNVPTNLIGKMIRILASRRVDVSFVISNAIRDNFATFDCLRKTTIVVYNGIDPGSDIGANIRNDFGVPEHRFVIGVVGQIAPWKRQLDALYMFKNLVCEVPDCELWIVGEPRFRSENTDYDSQLRCEAQAMGIAHQVRFLGFRDDVMNVMESIDVLLVPSENEPFGRVIIEAMLSGKPVVGTNAGGIPEIVKDGETGYLVAVGDVKGITQAILRLFHDTGLRVRFGDRARMICKECFSIQAQVRAMRAVYTSLANTKSRSGHHAPVGS